MRRRNGQLIRDQRVKPTRKIPHNMTYERLDKMERAAKTTFGLCLMQGCYEPALEDDALCDACREQYPVSCQGCGRTLGTVARMEIGWCRRCANQPEYQAIRRKLGKEVWI